MLKKIINRGSISFNGIIMILEVARQEIFKVGRKTEEALDVNFESERDAN